MKDQPLRVLIVEDSEDDTLLILRALKKGGYNPLYERVETYAAMQKALKEKQWDIILCDYKMVTFRGPSAIALLKETNIDIPLIIVSGAFDETMAVECMRLGAKDYVLKTNLSRLYPSIARELEDVEVRKKQRQTEEKLRAEEQRFKALVDHSSDIIVVLDTEATVIYVNPALEQVLGFKPEERIGKKGFELVHPDDINLLAEYFITLISDTNFPVIHWEMRLRHKNGNWRTLDAIGSNLIKNNIVEAVIVNYRDVTERERAKEALQESEARYRLISENTADLISILDMNLHFTYVSPASMRLRGFTVEEAMAQTIEQVLTPESLRLGLSVFEEEMELEARGTADPDRIRILELEEYKKDGSIIWMEVSLTFLREKDNKPTEILIVSRDITVRKQAEEKLRKSEEKYRLIFEYSPLGLLSFDVKGVIVACNDNFVKIIGSSREKLIGLNMLNLPDKNIVSAVQKALNGSPGFYEGDYSSTTAKKITPVRCLFAPIDVVGGRIPGGMGIIEDITERKQSEEKLRLSEEQYRKLVDQSLMGIGISKSNKVIFANSALLHIFGYDTLEEFVKIPLLDHVAPSSREMIATLAIKRNHGKESETNFEYDILRKDGETRTLHGYASHFTLGDEIYTQTTFEDITERKKAEKDLQENEERFRRISSITSDIAYSCSTKEDGRFSIDWMIGATERISGYSIEEIKAQSCWRFLVVEEDLTLFEKNVIGLSPGLHGLCELRIRHKNGGFVWITSYAECFMTTEMPEHFILYGALVDITNRRQVEESLRQSEGKYRTILEDIQEGYFEVDLAGNFTFFNDSLCRFLGYSKEELMGMNNRQYTDIEHSNKLFQAFNKVYKGGGTTEGFDWQIIRKDGTKRYVEASVSLRKDSSGKPIGFRGIARDVTDSKQADEALRESENRLRAQYNGNPIPTFTWQKQGDEFILRDFNDSAKIFTIGQRNSFLGRQASEMYKSRQEILGYLQRCFDEKRIIRIESISEHFMPGKFVVITFVFVPSDLVMVHMEDITERKKAEEALKNSEAKYRNIFENAIEGIYQSTIEGRFITVNGALARMAGYESPEELIKSIKDIGTQLYVYPEDRKRFMEVREAKGFVEGFEVEFYKKDGSKFWVVVNARTVNDEQGEILYIEGLIEDITIRKHSEKRLHQTLDKLKKAVGTTIQVLGTASEARDPYTAGHQKRVADLARVIATEMKLPPEKIEGIRMAGSIHDIGKISIPAEILSKPTKLTNTEFSIIKEHSQMGYEMLKDVESPWPLAEVVYQHHERMDGSGYPKNLKGDEILMESRILAVADVVEAMASHRPYRPTLGIEAALAEIEKNKGILYDDAVADTCLRLFRETGYKLA